MLADNEIKLAVAAQGRFTDDLRLNVALADLTHFMNYHLVTLLEADPFGEPSQIQVVFS